MPLLGLWKEQSPSTSPLLKARAFLEAAGAGPKESFHSFSIKYDVRYEFFIDILY